jgi:Tol biopolymer transport system component
LSYDEAVRWGVLAVVVAALSVVVSAAQASFPGKDGLIVFVRDGGKKPGIYVVAPSGKHLRRIVAIHSAGDLQPAWSPNGSSIAYLDLPSGDSPSIDVVSAQGVFRRSVAAGTSDQGENDGWTPGGRVSWLTHDSSGGTCVHVDGASALNFCTTTWLNRGRWSSTGAYAGAEGTELVLVSPVGREHRIGAIANPQSFDWSPSGSSIVFAENDLNGPSALIGVVKPNGKDWHLLRGGHVDGADPVWSPDGKHIVFANHKGLAIVDAHGRHLVQLTHNRHDGEPDWQSR